MKEVAPGRVSMAWQSLLGCILIILTLPMNIAAGAEDQLITTELNIGFPTSSFRTVNTTDAKAAVRVWIDTVGRSRGYDLVGETRVFNDSAAMCQQVRENLLDLVIIQAWDYLEILEEQLLKPLYVPAGRDALLDHYLLLVRRDSSISTVNDLRGKDIGLLAATGVNYSRQWLDILIGEPRLGSAETFFNSVTTVKRVSLAVLPVFFGKFDACVVDHSGFDTMRGMNPQLDKQLTTLAVSPPLMETIICLHKHGHEHEDVLVKAIADLDHNPRGKQILMVFKIDRLLPFDPADLENLRVLREQHLELTGEGLSMVGHVDQTEARPENRVRHSSRSRNG